MAYIIEKCKYCGSTEFYLEAKDKDPDILNAKVVNVRCKECGKWLGYANKGEREHYLGQSPEMPQESETEQDNVVSQETTESALQDTTSDLDTITKEEINQALESKGKKPAFKKEKVVNPKSYEYTSSGEIIEPSVEINDTISKTDLVNYIQMQKRIVSSTFIFDKGKALTILNNLIQYINSCN